ncbi:MAG: ATP-binding cassette domain-containing protein [Acidobacteriota bacterium]|jgi:sodium transport system ATP-binding protein|nr:ATP-binding cassette domain-containing protein [Acidobacteriota bacterium]
MIEVEKLSKRFRLTRKQKREMGLKGDSPYIWPVKEISFTCRPGRVFTLLGPNGAGKTTTLRLIATMLKPTEGAIRVAGYDTRQEPRKVRSSIGFLTGTTGLYGRLTADEIVRYYADLNSIDRDTFEKNRKHLFDLLDIHPFANRRIAKLSTGMRQKVSIARTMIHDPEVVVFDEPTTGLDVITARAIIELIRRCRQDGKTVIFSTHIMGEVNLLSDDLAIIHEGRLLFNGPFADFRDQCQSRTIEDEFIRLVQEA